MRILALVTDAFGGHGGIAKFNRDLLTALCANEDIDEVIALPRMMPHEPGPLPEKLTYITEGLGGKAGYAKAVLKAALRLRRKSVVRSPSSVDSPLIFCGHLNLLPLAWVVSRRAGAKLVLNLHGIEAWTPHRSWLVRRLLPRVDHFISVSEFTKARIRSWIDLDPNTFSILPNCVDLSAFGPGPKNPVLLERYGLQGKTTLMTLARLSSAERYKGIDEVLEVLPELARDIPNLAYMICGDGDDRPRLMAKAGSLGLRVIDVSERPASQSVVRSPSSVVSPIVVFTGRISEEEKADHYRLSDVFVMPGWGEGFGIVYLEALACGVPAIGSKADGSRDALLEGKLGPLVNPRDPEEIKQAIRTLLNRTDLSSVAALQKADAPASNGHTVNCFSSERFHERVRAIVKIVSDQLSDPTLMH